MLARLARSRLVWFVVLGAAFWFVHPRSRSRVVDLDRAALEALHEAQAKRLGVAALGEGGDPDVDAGAIEDEILYREALRLGLDRDDPIVRQRLAQKLLLLVEDLGGASRDPSPDDVRAHCEATRERWRQPDRHHVVFAFARDRARLPAELGTTPPDTGMPLRSTESAQSHSSPLRPLPHATLTGRAARDRRAGRRTEEACLHFLP